MTTEDDARVRAAVITALAVVTDRDPSAIHDGSTLKSLGLDSLGFTSLLLEVEETLGAELPLEVLAEAAEIENFTVVADIVRVLSAGDVNG